MARTGEIYERVVQLTLRAQRGQLPHPDVLAHEYGCCARTIRRVLVVIEQHIPIRYEGMRG